MAGSRSKSEQMMKRNLKDDSASVGMGNLRMQFGRVGRVGSLQAAAPCSLEGVGYGDQTTSGVHAGRLLHLLEQAAFSVRSNYASLIDLGGL